MRKNKRWFQSRLALYSMGLALLCILLSTGFILDPRYKMSLEDYEAELALNMWMGNMSAARENIKAIMELDPDNLYGLLMKAYIRYQDGEDEEALKLYKDSLRLIWKQPDLEDEILDTVSRLALKTGRYQEARMHADRRIRLVGENNISRFIIALSSHFLDDDKNFEESLDRAMSMGVFGSAFQINLNDLLGDNERVTSIYLKLSCERSRYERDLLETAW